MSGPGTEPALAVTWWGHSSTLVELAGVRVATDPLLTPRLAHLRRRAPLPEDSATDADVVVVSHLHQDHLHLPSLRRFSPDVPVVVPRGAAQAVRGLAGSRVVEVSPGDRLELGGLVVEVTGAHHDGRRLPVGPRQVPALGFRLSHAGRSCWYPGDTGLFDGLTDVDPVDLALVPVGGWGPTLPEDHLDPEQAARAVGEVGAGWALAIHYGTYWPVLLEHAHPRSFRHLFEAPPGRFVAAVEEYDVDTVPLTPGVGERLVLTGTARPR